MAVYKIELDEIEDLALSASVKNKREWIEKIAKNRARIEIEKIISEIPSYYLENKIKIPESKEELIKDAFRRGIIQTQ